MKSIKFISVILALQILIACQSIQKTPQKTLYETMGGNTKIELLTKILVDQLELDKKIGFLFEDTNKTLFQELLIQQICYETGGPCQYQGLTMLEAHSGMEIRQSEFDVFVQVFINSMQQANIPFATQNKLLAIFAPMRKEVIHQ